MQSTTWSKFATLLKSAKNMEEGVNNIKSVAEPETNIEHVESENKEKRRNKKELSEKNQISFLFEKSDKEDNRSEAVRIPSDIHRKLKLLASCSNTSIALILSNMDFDPGYLAGFYADRADVGSEAYKAAAKVSAANEAYLEVGKKLKKSGYKTVVPEEDDMVSSLRPEIKERFPVLFPVWFLT